MWSKIYKKIVIDFAKITLLFLAVIIIYSFYQAKNFNLDASSDALLLEGDKDLKYLREVNETYGNKDFLILTYTPVSSFTEKEIRVFSKECGINMTLIITAEFGISTFFNFLLFCWSFFFGGDIFSFSIV